MKNLTFAQLRQYAQAQGISVAAKLRKAELEKLLNLKGAFNWSNNSTANAGSRTTGLF